MFNHNTSLSGFFNAVGHCYKNPDNITNIELFHSDYFDGGLPSELIDRPSIAEYFNAGELENELLTLPEIEFNTSNDFYFEISGQIGIEFERNNGSEFSDEVSESTSISKCKFALLDSNSPKLMIFINCHEQYGNNILSYVDDELPF